MVLWAATSCPGRRLQQVAHAFFDDYDDIMITMMMIDDAADDDKNDILFMIFLNLRFDLFY